MYPQQTIKIETNIEATMRDGTILRADVYRPDDGEKHPTLVVRNSYNKSHEMMHNPLAPLKMAGNGYAVVHQDTRGMFASDGPVFDPTIHEFDDGYDTVEWAASQPWSDGQVGMYGLSYLAVVQWAAAAMQPPHLKAIMPGMIGPNLRDFAYQGGALLLLQSFEYPTWMTLLALAGKPGEYPEAEKIAARMIKGVDDWKEEMAHLPLKELPCVKDTGVINFYWDVLDHPDYDDYWQAREHLIPEKVTVPSFIYSGWYDTILPGSLVCYERMKARGGSESARKNVKLLIGPWTHNVELLTRVGGGVEYGAAAAGNDLLVDQRLRWFDYWLKGVDSGVMEEPPVRIFVMGENVWRDESEWPLARTAYTNYYLHGDGRANTRRGDGTLSPESPGSEEFDSFIYDPRNPAPTKGGMIKERFVDGGSLDQAEIEERADVLVYTTPPLERDLEVTGPVVVKLFAASSAPDTDFTAKLVDLWPGGQATLITDGIIRARYREGETKQSLIEPGKIYEYTIDLIATSNVFKAGHQIRVDISSSNFPRFDRNPNTGHAFGEDDQLEIAVQRIFHDKDHPSHIILPVIPR